MSFGEGNLRTAVAELQDEVTHLTALCRGMWLDLKGANPQLAEHWTDVCPELKGIVRGDGK